MDADEAYSGGVVDEEAPGPDAHEPAVGQQCGWYGRVGVREADGVAEVEEEVG
jgi:hypothetical protein